MITPSEYQELIARDGNVAADDIHRRIEEWIDSGVRQHAVERWPMPIVVPRWPVDDGASGGVALVLERYRAAKWTVGPASPGVMCTLTLPGPTSDAIDRDRGALVMAPSRRPVPDAIGLDNLLELAAKAKACRCTYAGLTDDELYRIGEGAEILAAKLDQRDAEIADLKQRLIGMTRCAADASKDVAAALTREGLTAARLRMLATRVAGMDDGPPAAIPDLVELARAALEHQVMVSEQGFDLVPDRIGHPRPPTEAMRALVGDAFPPAVARSHGTSEAIDAGLNRLATAVTGMPAAEVSAALDRQVAEHPDTVVIDDPDAPPPIAELVNEWRAAHRAARAAKASLERSPPDLVHVRRELYDASLAILDRREIALSKAVPE